MIHSWYPLDKKQYSGTVTLSFIKLSAFGSDVVSQIPYPGIDGFDDKVLEETVQGYGFHRGPQFLNLSAQFLNLTGQFIQGLRV